MLDRQQHLQEVKSFLQKRFSTRHWEITLPRGWGNESYFAHGSGQSYFIKLGVQIARYQAMSAIGLTPQVQATDLGRITYWRSSLPLDQKPA